MAKRQMSIAWRTKLNAVVRVTAREVKDGCDQWRINRSLCSNCVRYLMDMAIKPADFIELPSGRLLKPIPKCG